MPRFTKQKSHRVLLPVTQSSAAMQRPIYTPPVVSSVVSPEEALRQAQFAALATLAAEQIAQSQDSHMEPMTAQLLAAPVVQQTAYKSLSAAAALPAPAVQPIKATAVEWMELDTSNAAKYVATQNNNILSSSLPNHWHQIIVKTPVSTEYDVPEAINKRIAPLKIVPFFRGLDNGRLSFFVNNCSQALKTLCQLNLEVPCKFGDFDKIELILRLCAKTLNISETLQSILSSRLDSKKKNLDLSYLSRVPSIQEMLFDPSDVTPILERMFPVAEIIAPEIVSVNLAGNNLSSINSLGNFFAANTAKSWKHLRVLDLCHNKITKPGRVTSQISRISELYLDDNPICGNYKRDQYISVMKANFPGLIKLDGTYLQSITQFPFWKQNFIITNTHGDAAEIADQFLEHFYTIYDGDNRTWLRGLYHQEAYFSLASTYMVAQSTTSTARLARYLSACRNLLRSSDKKKEKKYLIFGQEGILDTLSNLPRTQHDPHTFTVDVTQNTDKCVVITVTGVFRDRNISEKTSPRHFMRTFILVKLEGNEFKILNDILYVSNAATTESEEAFTFSRPVKKFKRRGAPKPEMTECEKESLVDIVSQLTDMTPLWARKCLEDSDWDMKEALQVFLDLYKISKIPKAAFLNPKLQTGRT